MAFDVLNVTALVKRSAGAKAFKRIEITQNTSKLGLGNPYLTIQEFSGEVLEPHRLTNQTTRTRNLSTSTQTPFPPKGLEDTLLHYGPEYHCYKRVGWPH